MGILIAVANGTKRVCEDKDTLMRLTFRHQAFKAAITAVLASSAVALTGCDARSTSDSKAAQSILNEDFQAAAKEKNASPALTALAAKVAASEQVASSLPTYQSLADQQIVISQKLWQLGRLNITAQHIATSANELNKYKPDAALAELDKTQALVRGGTAKDWTVAEGVNLPTAATSLANANALKDKIAETQRTLADLKQKHDQLEGNSRQLMEQSNSAKGEQAVSLFKQSADARKQAAETEVQLEKVEASLVPMQQDLQVAEDQSRQSAQTLDLFAGQRDAIEKGWRGVAAQMEQRTGYAGQVYSKMDDPQFASVSLGAGELAQLTDQYTKQTLAYQQQLDGASALVRDAVGSSEKTIKDMMAQGATRGSPIVKLTEAVFDPSAARLLQGQIQYDIGSALGAQGSLTAYESRIAETTAQVGAALKQPVPESMNDAARAKLKTDQIEQLTKAGESLKAAGETFDTVSQAMATTPDAKQAATIGRMISLADASTVMQTSGDAAAAKQALDEAKALRDSLLQAGPLLGLPDTLMSAAPAAPATTPTTGAVEQQ